MTKSLNALSANLIDYAGLFPPARLDMKTAVVNYKNYRKGNHAEMLGGFICPVGRLKQFVEEWGDQSENVAICLLIGSGENGQDFIDNFAEDWQSVKEIIDKDFLKINIIESKLPLSWVDETSEREVFSLLKEIHSLADDVSVFFETKFHQESKEQLSVIASQFHNYREKNFRAGFKIRCGGLDSSFFPSVEQIALALHICLQQKIPLKATAGLHHPVRHYHDSLGTHMHGFINVFGAATLAYNNNLPLAKIIEILEEQDGSQFIFEKDLFRWRDFTAEIAQIHAARILATSYGSCSFEEPLADLKQMKLLD